MHAKAILLGLCTCLIIPSGTAGAKQPGDQLTVVAPTEDEAVYQKWTDRAAERLSRSIRQVSWHYRDVGDTGYARVQFRLNAQGRPEAVSLAEPSSSFHVNRISMRAVKGVGSLYPLPQRISANSQFEAWIIVADDWHDQQVMLNRLRTQHATTMAQAKGPSPVLIAAR